MRGRGSAENPPNRFEELRVELEPGEAPENPRTQFLIDSSQSIISRNDSPDISFSAGVNPYRGCEHGCPYCYARPYHEYLGFSGGLDFEQKIMVKPKAAELLRAAFMSPKWCPEPLAMSGITDCYQPIERRLKITRACLEVLAEFRNPVGMITKNHLITRDADLLGELARHQAANAHITVTSLDADLAHRLEPRASSPNMRLAAVRELSSAGVPVGVIIAPVIPGLNDHEIPAILQAAAEAGATRAAYTLLRLPYGVKEIFFSWLEENFPGAVEKIRARIAETRAGGLSDGRFGSRMRGEGAAADRLKEFFRISARRAGLSTSMPALSVAAFRRPPGPQMELFG